MASGLSTSQIITVLLPACLHGDHLGSASLTTNAAGQKVSEQPFGKLRAGCYKPGACPERQRGGEVRWSSGAGMPTDPSTDRITGPSKGRSACPERSRGVIPVQIHQRRARSVAHRHPRPVERRDTISLIGSGHTFGV